MLRRPASDESPARTELAALGSQSDRLETWKPLIKRCSVILAVACLIWYADRLHAQAYVFRTIDLDRSAVGALAFGVVAFPLMYAAVAAVWVCALRAIGCNLSLKAAITICAVTQFGKYIPGNVAHHLGRAVQAKRQGVSGDRFVAALFIETVNLFVCGALICGMTWSRAGSMAIGHFASVPGVDARAPQIVMATLVALAGIACFGWLAATKYDVVVAARRVIAMRWLIGWLMGCVLVQTLIFWVNGTIAIALLRGVFKAEQLDIVSITGLYAVAWIAGFVTLGAPAGLGVREAVITYGLTSSCGTGVAVGLAAMLRVVSTLGDGLTFGLGLLWQHAEQRRRHQREKL